MKVRALEKGYYGHKLRREGEVFHVEGEKAFSKKWMEKISGGKRKANEPEIIEDGDGGFSENAQVVENQDVI